MSSVSNLILHVADSRDERLTELLDDWMAARKHGVFMPVGDDYYNGPKAFEALVYIATANYLNKDEFLAMFRSLPWRDPSNVQMLIKGQHDGRFSVYSVVDGGE
jgi:hypothetical protein